MILLVAATEREAAEIKKSLSLKARYHRRPFPIYQSQEAALAISGVGKMRAAAATAFLLSRFENSTPVLINFGLCGAVSKERAVGTSYMVPKIRDHGSGSCYFPDQILRHPFEEAPLVTVDRPRSHDEGLERDELVDMEAAGVLDAALRFLDSWQVSVVKTVCDHLDPQSCDRTLSSHLPIAAILDHGLRMRELAEAFPFGLDAEERRCRDQLVQGLRLTRQQSHQLDQALLAFRCSGGRIAGLEDRLLAGPRPENKQEVRQRFERLLHDLHPTEL